MTNAVFVQLAKTVKTDAEIEKEHSPEFRVIRTNGASIGIAHVGEYDSEGFIRACRGNEIVLCGGNPPMSAQTIAEIHDTKLFIRYGIGIDSFDFEACTQFEKIVYYMPGYCSEELAEHALSMILGLLRNTVYYDRGMRSGLFPKAAGPAPRRLGNLILGLFGMGNSARHLSAIVKGGFGSRVIGCDPYLDDKAFDALGIRHVSFDELLHEADIISIHAPLTEETRHIFNKEAFKAMRSDAIVINTSRGALINTEDLIEALTSKEIGGAGLDVFEREPVDLRLGLGELDNVVLTPHSAYYGKESALTQSRLASKFAEHWLKDRTINRRYIANKNVLERFSTEGIRIIEEDWL